MWSLGMNLEEFRPSPLLGHNLCFLIVGVILPVLHLIPVRLVPYQKTSISKNVGESTYTLSIGI